MRRIKKFAAGGSTGRYQAKYDRKVADIDSDYEKMLKRGVDKRVADAKRAQRMADAKDDMAKWTKSDRTETRAAKKASERSLSETRRSVRRGEPAPVEKKAEAPKAEAPKFESKPVVQETPKAEAKKSYDDMSFSAAFRQAMKDKGKGETFTWKGESYKLEYAGAKKPTSRAPASPPASAPARAPARNAGPPTAARGNARPPATPGLTSEQYTRAVRTGVIPGNASAEDRANLHATIKSVREAQSGKYAKGGVVKKSINGIAKRGLTRGARKK